MDDSSVFKRHSMNIVKSNDFKLVNVQIAMLQATLKCSLSYDQNVKYN